MRVRPIGDKKSKICLIGEAPGATEERLGIPFVGQAGNLLNNLLNSVGLTRSECYITNVVKERPPRNDFSPYFNGQSFTEKARPWLEELREELNECEANVFVPLGSPALFALTNKIGIMKWRGSILESTMLPGRKVIPTIHPAAALRMYIFRYHILSDLSKVNREKEFPEIRVPEREIIISPSYEQTLEFFELIKNSPAFAFDIEVFRGSISCISFAVSPYKGISIPFKDKNGSDYFSDVKEREIWKLINEALTSDKLKIGQNINFDISYLYNTVSIMTKPPIADTMIAHHVTYYELPKGLDYLTSIYTNEPYYKDEGKIWTGRVVYDENFWIYNAKDSLVTFEVWEKVEKEMKERGCDFIYNKTMELFWVVLYFQLRGIKVNVDSLDETRKELESEIEVLQSELNDIVGHELNPNSPSQCKNYFYVEKGLKAYVNRKTGSLSTNDEALTRLSAKGIREADLVLKLREKKKLLSTYVNMELDEDNRMRTSYDLTGTTTGRLSSRKTPFGTGMNMQNLPKAFRKFLVADEGRILVELDKSQAEAIVVAYLSEDEQLIKLFESGLDIHTENATRLFSLIYRREITREEVLEEHRRLGNSHESMRYKSKKTIHSSNYGLGYKSLALILRCQEKEAKTLLEAYHQLYPGIRMWHRRIEEKLREDRTLTNLLGRKRIFLGRWGDEMFRAAYAYIPQSTVSDLLNFSLIDIYNSDLDYMKPIDHLAQVHDSYLFQYPADRMEDLAKAIQTCAKLMDKVLRYGARSFTIKTTAAVGLNWKDLEEVNCYEQDYKRLADILSEIHRKHRASS